MATEKPPGWHSFTVRLIPSMAMEPFSIMYLSRLGSRLKEKKMKSPFSCLEETVATVSTCPLTMCPPSLSERRRARSRFTLSFILMEERVVRLRLSGETSTLKASETSVVTVRQTPFTAMDSPSSGSFSSKSGLIKSRVPLFIGEIPVTVPRPWMIPVNMASSKTFQGRLQGLKGAYCPQTICT